METFDNTLNGRAALPPHPSLKNKGLDMGWAGSAVNISRAHKS